MKRWLRKTLSAIGRWGFTIMIVPRRGSVRRLAIPWLGVICLLIGLGVLAYYPFSVTNNVRYMNMIDNLRAVNSRLDAENKSLQPALRRDKQAASLLNDLKREHEATMAVFNAVRRKSTTNMTSRGGSIRYQSYRLPEPIKAGDGHVSLLETLDANSNSLSTETTRLLTQERQLREQLQAYEDLLDHTPNFWPTSGRMTSRFGYRIDPVTHHSTLHTGLDIAVHIGTPVRAAADGVVVFADWRGGYGRAVVIKHGYGYQTLYGHNNELLVSVGQTVKKGQIIARSGSSGKSTGPHVHFEIWINGSKINPLSVLR